MIPTRLNAKTQVIAFTSITFLFSWSFLWAATHGFSVPGWAFPFILMWIPGVVSIALRIGFREGFLDAGFRAGRLRFWMIAYVVPLALAAATYFVAWLMRQVYITPYLQQQSMFGPLPFRLVWFNNHTETLGLISQRLAVVMTLGIIIGFLSGLGEEIGWRGYLLPKLVKANVRYPILASGIIWGTWHVPFVLLTFQHQRYITAVLYWTLCIVFAIFIGWIRLASGSVFVAGMAHGAYNTFYQDFFDHSFAGPHKWFWAGEVGLLCSVAFGALALWLYRTDRIAPLLQPLRTEPALNAVS